jgi:hypothetical protein
MVHGAWCVVHASDLVKENVLVVRIGKDLKQLDTRRVNPFRCQRVKPMRGVAEVLQAIDREWPKALHLRRVHQVRRVYGGDLNEHPAVHLGAPNHWHPGPPRFVRGLKDFVERRGVLERDLLQLASLRICFEVCRHLSNKETVVVLPV